MNHIWSVLCERVSVDQRTNAVSLFTCLEKIQTFKIPISIPTITIASFWFNPETGASLCLRIVLVKPDKSEEVIVQSDDMKFQTTRQRFFAEIHELKMPDAGTYFFKIQNKTETKWRTVTSIPLDIMLSPEAPRQKDQVTSKAKK